MRPIVFVVSTFIILYCLLEQPFVQGAARTLNEILEERHKLQEQIREANLKLEQNNQEEDAFFKERPMDYLNITNGTREIFNQIREYLTLTGTCVHFMKCMEGKCSGSRRQTNMGFTIMGQRDMDDRYEKKHNKSSTTNRI